MLFKINASFILHHASFKMSSRRNFIKKSAALGLTAPWINTWQQIGEDRPKIEKKPGFSLKMLATNWGFSGTLDAFCAKAKADGYDGFEVWVPDDRKGQEELLAAAAKHSLQFGLLCGGWQPDPVKHLEHFEKALTQAIALKPLYVNCHSGRDWFSVDQNRRFIEVGTRQSEASGVPVYHETHRGRILFAAHITKQYMDAFPKLRLTLDISHWCNVHESLLNDQEATVAQALDRTDHIHTRVGHAEGPQVNDPRAPEWGTAFKQHLEWWDKVVARKAQAGQVVTMLTEFGPPDYLPALPYTRQPVADQWGINVYMKDFLKARYL